MTSGGFVTRFYSLKVSGSNPSDSKFFVEQHDVSQTWRFW